MITKMKKKFASCIAIVCAIMILIGIFPTNIFGSSNTVDAVGTVTVYLDIKYGPYQPWRGCSTVYIYTFSDGTTREMEKVSDGLFKYTLTDTDAKTGFLFRTETGSNWIFDNQTEDIHNPNDGACYYIDSPNGKKKVNTRADFTPPITSLAGKTIYVKDMVGDATEVTATFYISDNSYSTEITLTPEGEKQGSYFTKIPTDYLGKPYDTVEISYTTADGTYSNNVKYGIMGEGNSISNSYFNYDENNCNTYYIRAYGDDEEIERKISCYWERPLNTTSLYNGVEGTGAHRLYFDSNYFNDGSATIEFGYGGNKVNAATLQYDETAGRYYYEIPSSLALTQEDIITVRSDGKEYRMFWFDMNNNIATVTTLSNPNGTAAFISDLYKAGSKRIYFDATMSKLYYTGDATAGTTSGMGASEMYCSYGSDNAGLITSTQMKKAEPHSNGKNTWNDVYYIDVADTNKFIRFSAASGGGMSSHGRKTGSLEIPTNLTKPCFYADSSDDVIYGGSSRDGYWDEVYTIRDAETGKEGKDVVDIKTDTFTKDPDKLYVDTTFYDYYSDYELNGNNRDSYTNPAGASYRNWYIYRQFNQALSDYYRENNVQDPLYEGHFQPDYWAKDSDAFRFSKISSTLGLYGFDDYYRFISNNNSLHAYNGDTYGNNPGSKAVSGYDFAYVTQGLANSKLINGKINTYGSDTTVIPFFNEDFLSENNSKNAKLGDVYKNVSFPFTKEKVSTTGGGTVDYWTFDASKTTLEMKNDSGKYFLKDVGSLPPWSCNWGSGGASSTEDGRKAVHGFFPFNGTSNGSNSATYNYGYGMKMEFQFRLTKDGKVLDSKNTEAPIRFEFSGDDDVWVYIDGELVLDLGGQHGKATGTIDFSNNTSTVSAVKPSNNINKTGTNVTNTFSLKDDTTDGTISHKTTTEHTLVMYYMERGQWESNMRVQFNFPDNNELEVEKNVEYEGIVNPMFYDFFKNNSNFAFTIQNYATHYAAKDVDTTTLGKARPFASTFTSFVKPTDTSTKAEKTTDSGSSETVIHWSSTAENNNRTQTASRLVTINSDSGGNVDASNCEYMRFNIAVPASSADVSNTLALSKMYICFTDSSGKTAHGYLTSSRLMGVPDIEAVNLNMVRVLLDKLSKDDGFDWAKIKSIGFQYDDPADIYISEFVFQPQPNLSESTGFVTNQYEIPDYGSVKAGGLTNVTGAVYTTDNATPTDTGDDSLRVVGTDSQFFLKNNETVTFSDQFRRGSYIYLNEELTKAQDALFDTTYTVYEDGKPVNAFVNTNNVINGTTITDLVNKSGTSVEDDRTEIYVESTVDGHDTNNTGYTSSQQPNKDSFVFRSYLTNESGTGAGSLTKLKVVYTNTAKVGTLKITKGEAYGSKPLDGTYKFYVEFYNVGGVALEDDTIITKPYEITKDNSIEIQGIPVGTQFTIHEVQPTDGSSLKNVNRVKGGDETSVEIKNDTITVNEGGTDKTYNTRSVSGSIDNESSEYEYKMLNYKYTVMVEIEKKWDNIESIDPPLDISEVKFQLQRREKVPAGQLAKTWEDVEVITVSKNSETGAWDKKGIGGPYDFYVGNDPSNNPYEYRVIELNPDETQVTDGTYKNNGRSFNVTYDPETAYVEESSPPVDNTLNFTVTNTYVETTEYNAVKEWYDETGTNLTAPDVGTQLTLKLQSTTNDPAGATDWKNEKTVTVRFDGTKLTLDPSVDDVECSLAVDPTNVNSKWKVVFKNLPKQDTDGITLHYRVIEAPVPSGYTQMTEGYNNDEDTKTSTIKNKKDKTLTTYKVTKQWPDGLPEDGSVITLQLQQTTENTPLEGDWGKATATNSEIVIKYGSDGITVKKSDGSFGTDTNLTSSVVGGVNEWYYRWNNLPATDDSSGKTIKYRVVETKVCNGYFTASQEQRTDTESVIVNKKVVEMPSAGSIPFIFNFALFGGIVIAISLVILHLNRKFNIFQRIMRNFKGV